MHIPHKLKKAAIICTLLGTCAGAIILCGLFLYLTPLLPPVETLKNIQLQTPLRIYSADHKLIAEYGEKRRAPVAFDEIPPLFIRAILAAEDDRFEKHHGVDIGGLMRAALQLAGVGGRQTGASTITMQVARNYFLSNEITFSRKFNEILLALQIEQELSKQEILELYVNKIFLGHRAYGVDAAAKVYYGKSIKDLTLAQLAMIAGVPKGPSTLNPITNPERALTRRDWILKRMLKLKSIDQSQHDEAISHPVTARFHGAIPEVEAPYLAEMVRQHMLTDYSQNLVYTGGLRVYTTINSSQQLAANKAVIKGLLDYDRRHGYRGPEERKVNIDVTDTRVATDYLRAIDDVGPLQAALVRTVAAQSVTVVLANGREVSIPWNQLKWARRYISPRAMGARPKQASDILAVGDRIRVLKKPGGIWALAQVPIAQSALIALTPTDGAVNAIVGGFDFRHSKYNRAAQGKRQPGSSFKPFIYTAALDHGYTAASIINDAPVFFNDEQLEDSWRPENDDESFQGPTRLRKALYRSRNLVSVRLLQALTVSRAIRYVKRFGFPASRLPRDLSLALGSAEFTPLEMATGYATFANGGYKVEPYFIDRIEDSNGKLLFIETPKQACPECNKNPQQKVETPQALEDDLAQALARELEAESPLEALATPIPAATETQLREIKVPDSIKEKILPAPRVVDERTLYLIDSILKDVVRRGTGRRARTLGRHDLAGKTGTTNDQKDAWFSGYNRSLVTTVWVGFDQPQTLGTNEWSTTAALPVWIDFMAEALRGVPERTLAQPDGLVAVRIDPGTGARATPGQENAIFETFRVEYAPRESSTENGSSFDYDKVQENIPEQLF